VTKALFTPGPTTFAAPFRGIPGERPTSWDPNKSRLEALYPTVIFNRGCCAKLRAQNLLTGGGRPPAQSYTPLIIMCFIQMNFSGTTLAPNNFKSHVQ
jgi:hypothetical protein